MSSISIRAPAGVSSSGSSSTSAATGAVAALNSPRMDENINTTRESSAEVESAAAQRPQQQDEKKGWFWSQFITRSGLFAPLAPEDSPEAVAEREKREQARLRQEKLESVHRWRPSQDTTTSPQKQRSSSTHPSRPNLMKRLSSAVELKWWSGDAATRTEEDEDEQEEEDLQKPKKRLSRVSQSSMSRDDDIQESNTGDIQLR